MPYNTRRKSLSLPSLGIHLPVSHASRAAAAAEKAAIKQEEKENREMSQTPAKKCKTSHVASSPAVVPYTPCPPGKTDMSPPSLPMSATIEQETAAQQIPTLKTPSTLKYEHTPPPSPEADMEVDSVECENKGEEIDMAAINDDIVEAVVVQLLKTGNRPHLVKELAGVLGRGVRIVETSANPSAIISSRLSTYLKRPCWSASNPCPLAKELETVHPRRTYFYLTTFPHQLIPDPATLTAAFPQRSIISPSLSSAESATNEDEDAQDIIRRRQLSPSPEVDLATMEFDEPAMEDDASVAPPTPSGNFSGRLVKSVAGERAMRGQSPPLEKDEKEFTLTARGMQRRRLGRKDTADVQAEKIEPSEASRERDMDGDLFGDRHQGHQIPAASSPAMKPASLHIATGGCGQSVLGKRNWGDVSDMWREGALGDVHMAGVDGEGWDSRSPEMVDLDELDGLLYGF